VFTTLDIGAVTKHCFTLVMGWTWKRDTGSLLLLIVVIIVVVILVLLLQPMNAVAMPIEQTFHVSMQQLQRVDGPLKYVINNEISPTLRLKKGSKYRFVLDGTSEPLYLTTSSVGGESVPESIAVNVDKRGIVDKNGDMFIITDRDVKPGVLYYQSTKSQRAGGMIVIS
jgi:hypothetical protein